VILDHLYDFIVFYKAIKSYMHITLLKKCLYIFRVASVEYIKFRVANELNYYWLCKYLLIFRKKKMLFQQLGRRATVCFLITITIPYSVWGGFPILTTSKLIIYCRVFLYILLIVACWYRHFLVMIWLIVQLHFHSFTSHENRCFLPSLVIH